MKKKDIPMDEDIAKYPVYVLLGGLLLRNYEIKSTEDYNHWESELHHWIPKTIRKNDPLFYTKVEHLQKLILLPAKLHRSLPNWTNETCLKETGFNKRDLLFSKDEWLKGYYKEKE
jgi:hypothetical protein